MHPNHSPSTEALSESKPAAQRRIAAVAIAIGLVVHSAASLVSGHSWSSATDVARDSARRLTTRPDEQRPQVKPLVLRLLAKPFQLLGHRSHSSHSSHASHGSHGSHSSHYSGSGPGLPAPSTPKAPAPSRPVAPVRDPLPIAPAKPTSPQPLTPVAPVVATDVISVLEREGSFELFLTAIRNAGLTETLRGSKSVTVFAPTDDAFRMLPAAELATLADGKNKERLARVVKYHVATNDLGTASLRQRNSLITLCDRSVALAVAEGQLRVERAKVVRPDIKCSNGTVHAVDGVLLPGEGKTTDVLSAKGFTTMKHLILKAGLEGQVDGEWPITIFAPTDAAFAALPKGTLDRLLQPDAKLRLIEFVNAHMVVGRVYRAGLGSQRTLKALDGRTVEISQADSEPKVFGQSLDAGDITSSNAIIHGVNGPLLKLPAY